MAILDCALLVLILLLDVIMVIGVLISVFWLVALTIDYIREKFL